ncbi:hypothetical protein KZO83_07730 [Chromohalobacter sp. TMW 2.2308]|uniref:hypothetical protein n=1 Tax=Chromohalobacter TaxID=42054 RepID=UPI001FFC63F1|nr:MULTISPECIES: hypothetical protein [Chromohalobacter]MCK2042577.1 hypothetical protein [Chromohalobacter moromii]MCT8514905.1 hypothetical protein [Chromohalobacter sp. TMW 2.2271]
MPNLRFIINNAHDGTLLNATSNALPITNTQRSERVKVWRSTNTSQQVIDATLPTPTYLGAVVLYRHNLSSGSRVRLELLVDNDVIYDSGSVNISGLIPLGEFAIGVDPWGATSTDSIPTQQAAFWLPVLLATRYRITIDDPDNLDGYMEIGRIISGQVISPKFNASYGLTLEWQDAGEHRRTEGGSLRTVGEGLSRRLPIDLDWLDATDRARFTAAILKSGKNRDIYVSVLPEEGGIDEAEYAFLARRENNYAHTHNQFNNWRSQLIFLEV